MTGYSVQPRDRIFVKGYRFLSFARNMGKNVSINLSGKYSQELLYHATQSATGAIKTSPQNNSVTNEEENIKLNREIHRERYISPETR